MDVVEESAPSNAFNAAISSSSASFSARSTPIVAIASASCSSIDSPATQNVYQSARAQWWTLTHRATRRERLPSGKARYIGFSEWTPEQIQAAIDIAGPDLFVSSQPQYSMLWQAPEDQVMPLCAANGISQIAFSPLAQGVLTGKYRPGQPFPSDSRAANKQSRADMAA